MSPLYAFLNRRVQTPKGEGVLLQVLESRCMVDLGRTRVWKGREHRVADFFRPDEIMPIGEVE